MPVLFVERRFPLLNQGGFEVLARAGGSWCPVKEGNPDGTGQPPLAMGSDVVIDVAFAVVFALPALVRFHRFAHVEQEGPMMIDDEVVSRNPRIFHLPAPKFGIQGGQAEGVDTGGDFCGGGVAAE